MRGGLKSKLDEEGVELYDKIVQLKIQSSDGKKYETECAKIESMFRIIQSITFTPLPQPFLTLTPF
jgi:hypothetical protein